MSSIKGKRQPVGIGMVPCKTDLGKFLRARRLQLNLRQVQVAQQAGICPSCYSGLEVGVRKYLSAQQVESLAVVLACDPADLYAVMPEKHHAEPRSERGWFIQTRLDELGITRKELARRLQISHQQCYQLMYSSRKGFRYQMLHRLAQALEVEAASLGRFANPKFATATESAFGQVVRDRRRQLGLGIRQLADKLGVSHQRVSMIEHGHVQEESVLERLAAALELDIAVLQAVRPKRRIKQVETDQDTLGGFLAARRLELHITQRELATRVGINQGYVSRAEHGHQVASATIDRITRALGCAVPVELLPHPSQNRLGARIRVERDTPLGRFVTERRIALGLSQEQVARKAGLGTATVYQIEVGISSGRFTLAELCQALECEIPRELVVESYGRVRRTESKRGRRSVFGKRELSQRNRDDLRVIRELSNIRDDSKVTMKALQLFRKLLERQKEGYAVRLVKGSEVVELELLL